MAREMAASDLVITSAGRTTFEVACVGTPAIVIAQNERELTHLFATPAYGFANLGLGSELTDAQILAAFDHLVADRAARQSMHQRMTDESLNGGLERVRLLIEELATT
jgi:spore coat polysaccharide biosynthesis predicted glycosyltransferase SpsG